MGIIDRKLLWLALSGTGAANLSGADALLDGEAQGLAFDFTDQSVRIIDTSTPSNSTRSTGIVNQGSLVGPSGKLDYTSPSNKLTMQADGYVKYQAHNLVTYSDLQTTGWTSGRLTISNNEAVNPLTGETTASKLTETTDNATHRAYSDTISVVSGSILSVSIYAKSGGAANNKLRVALKSVVEGDAGWDGRQGTSYFDLDSGVVGGTGGNSSGMTSTITSVGNGWYLCTVTASVNVTSFRLFFYSINDAGSDSYTGDLGNYTFVSNAHVYRYPANTDYIATTSAAKYALPYTYDTSGNCLGLLVEWARTNSALYSSVLDNAYWGVTNAVVASTAAQQPFLSGVYTLTPSTATSGVHRLIRSGPTNVITLGAAQSLVFSVYAKANGYTRIGLRESLTTGATCVFTLSGSGSAATPHSAGNITASNATIESVGNGWYRCAIVFTASSSTNTSPGVYVASPSYTSGDVESASWTPNGSDGVYVSQIDYCYGSFPTSPIITYGAAASRLGDHIYMPMSSTPLPGMTGASDVISGYAQFESANEASPGRFVFSARHEAGGNANTIYIYQSTTTQLASATTDAGAQTAFTNPGPNVAGADWQVAWRAKNDDYAISVAGLAQRTDTTADVMGVALDRLYIGNRANGEQGNRTIQKIVFVPTAWSDATLETKVGN